MNIFYQVAVNLPITKSILTYRFEDELEVGELVEVPLGNRKAYGCILNKTSEENLAKIKLDKIKPIHSKLENAFKLTENELKIYTWMSHYYHYSLGRIIFDCLPKILKRPRTPEFLIGKNEKLPFDLNDEQVGIVNSISERLNTGFNQNYIHGVTGAGKSAVYLELMKKTLAAGKSVQFLLPEINLTPQFTQMFESYLNCEILVYHSGVTPSEKYNIWKTLNHSEKPYLVMGVRSSIFLPLKNLGLIIVDEEHDQSFKQTDRCTYNGRDIAIKKAQINECTLIMGSATPSFENFYLFEQEQQNRFYYPMTQRVGEGHFPELVLMDTKNRFTMDDPAWPFLEETLEKIQEAMNKKEQVLIFINKLGYSNYVQCRNCGYQFLNDKCGCQNNLRYFKKSNMLSCAHCEYKAPLPEQCPECASISLLNKGFGTEKVESVLKDIFKSNQIERFDRDEIKTTKDLTKKLDRFHSHEIDILVGTQMLAKGHNFKKVNLVVILGVDAMLNFADFRTNEKTYQLIEQVAGRAGRYSPNSEVVIQTMNPTHSVFKFIKAHSFNGIYKDEMPLREICACPPYTKIVMIYFSCRFRDKLVSHVNQVATSITPMITKNFPEVRMYGPTPLSVEKKANQFTWAMMFKSGELSKLHHFIDSFQMNYKVISGISYKIDVDPIHLL